ncbi:hypothetical protein, partial [Xanthovirga aplysinae]|uniref:hypothetical protein n=1 Tax=Xanthovirga aplysinae TaxID=2529853 RepID=UPI003CCCA346
LGSHSGYTSTGSSNVFIGYAAGWFETGSNKLYIANDATSTPLIYGDFANKTLTFNGLAGMGIADPLARLHVYDANDIV